MAQSKTDKKPGNSSLVKQFGIVVMLDVLGVSSYSIEQSEEFIVKEKVLIKNIKKLHEGLDSSHSFKNAIIRTFGDTIIICWPLDVTKEKWSFFSAFTAISIELREIICNGIANGILFRGCISVGNYISDENTILGPAVFDANDWYSEADWFGVIISPKGKLWLDVMLEIAKREGNRGCELFKRNVVPHEVPLISKDKIRNKKMFLTIAWPYKYYHHTEANKEIFEKAGLPPETADAFEGPLETLSKQLFDLHIPKYAESKIKNSVDYFHSYPENFAKWSRNEPL